MTLSEHQLTVDLIERGAEVDGTGAVIQHDAFRHGDGGKRVVLTDGIADRLQFIALLVDPMRLILRDLLNRFVVAALQNLRINGIDLLPPALGGRIARRDNICDGASVL